MNLSVNNESMNASALLNSFSKYSSDGNTSTECSIMPVPVDPISVAVNELMEFKSQNNTTLKSTSDLAKLLNNKPNAYVKLPTLPSQLKSGTHLRYKREFIVICDCNKLCDKNGWCAICKKENKKGKSNFIVKIPIKQQINELLNKNFEAIIQYMNRDKKKDVISDIDDGLLFKRLSEENSDTNILGFTINCDGAPLYNSSKVSMWPVLLIANFLPPEIRYKQQNVLVHSIYISKLKPEFHELFFPLAQEIEALQNSQIKFWHNQTLHKFIPIIMCGAFDLPARAMASGLKLFNGTKSCVYCMHNGIQIQDHLGNKYVRYVKMSPEPERRTHAGFVSAISKFDEKLSPDQPYGLNNIPPMILFPKFDLVNGFCIDYMHNAALNIIKLLIDLWTGSHRLCKNSKYFTALSKKSQKILNKRLTSLKPCSYIRRKPRSLVERAYYKASEYRYLLLFYLRYGLRGLLDDDRLKHFEQFSAAVYILLKSEITKNDMEEARMMLKRFSDDFERLYGTETITMNIHMLKHYVDSVLECGPLWSYAMFTFEKKLGNLKKNVTNATDALDSISFHYCLPQKQTHTINNVVRATNKGKLKDSQITAAEKNILIEYLTDDKFEFSHSCEINSHIYKSTKSPITKSIDYFIEIKNTEEIGCIKLFVMNNENMYALVEIYKIIDKNYHLIRIATTEQQKVFPVKAINCQLIYMKFGCFQIVSKEPNFFETT